MTIKTHTRAHAHRFSRTQRHALQQQWRAKHSQRCRSSTLTDCDQPPKHAKTTHTRTRAPCQSHSAARTSPWRAAPRPNPPLQALAAATTMARKALATLPIVNTYILRPATQTRENKTHTRAHTRTVSVALSTTAQPASPSTSSNNNNGAQSTRNALATHQIEWVFSGWMNIACC